MRVCYFSSRSIFNLGKKVGQVSPKWLTEAQVLWYNVLLQTDGKLSASFMCKIKPCIINLYVYILLAPNICLTGCSFSALLPALKWILCMRLFCPVRTFCHCMDSTSRLFTLQNVGYTCWSLWSQAVS